MSFAFILHYMKRRLMCKVYSGHSLHTERVAFDRRCAAPRTPPLEWRFSDRLQWTLGCCNGSLGAHIGAPLRGGCARMLRLGNTQVRPDKTRLWGRPACLPRRISEIFQIRSRVRAPCHFPQAVSTHH